jgi:DNA-binding transcriptional ArsR family regulator
LLKSVEAKRAHVRFETSNNYVDTRPPSVIICIMTQINKHMPPTPKLAAACCSPLDGLLDADFFKALGDPTRLKMLSCLARCGRRCSVSEIAECCSVDFSVVSRHLAILDRAGVVHSTKEGRTVYYAVLYDAVSRRFKALANSMGKCAGSKRKCCAT